jgi:glutathione S-transferase
MHDLTPSPEALAERQWGGYVALDALERGLADGRDFLAGAFSIADIALYAYTHVAHQGGFDLSGYPWIRAWIDRVAAQPGYVPIDH